MRGKIFINGTIGKVKDEKESVDLIDIITQVKRQPDAVAFDVFINSEGGNVFVGYDIYNYLKSLKVPIRTIGQGVVASISTVIFMAGEVREVMPNTLFMIHLPFGTTQGTAEELEAFAKKVKKWESDLVDFYVKALNVQKEAILPLMKAETFLNMEQLMDLGFITQKPLEIAAKANITKPKKDKKMKGKKNTDILEKILNVLKGKKDDDAIENKMVYTAENKEVVFPDLADEDEVVVGENATVDGQPAEGEIVMQDGRTFVFEKGELKEIKEAAGGEDDDPPAPEAMAEMQKKLDEMATKLDSIQNKYDTLKKDSEKNEKILAQLGEITSEYEEEESKRDRGAGKTSVSKSIKAMRSK